MAAFLENVGRRQIDGNPLGRQAEAERAQGRADAFAAFADGFVRQTDDGESGNPPAIVTCTSIGSVSIP